MNDRQAVAGKPTHGDIYERLGEILAKLETLESEVGSIKAKVMAYDRLKERIIGALMAGSVLVAALWWLTKAKVAAVFGVPSA